jgi:N-acetylglutamate synthase-like GNAT family acetyltransferase
VGIAQKTIIDITSASLEDSVRIIRSAFGEVASELGITLENAARFPAFITLERLEEMRAGGALFFGLFVNGSQAGVVALKKEATGEYYMKRLAVLPEYWRGGLGRELVQYVIDYVRRMGIRELHITMVNEQTVLKKWYQGMGFWETEVEKFEHLPFSICCMVLDID